MSEAGHPPTLGVLLAGGLARRMGGGDKPLKAINGRTILERVIERFAPQCDEVILNANGDPSRFLATGLPVVPDTVPDFAGPLAGILAALEWSAQHRPAIRYVASVAADTPFLPHDLVSRLHAARQAARTPLACAESAGQAHPVNALWAVDLKDDLRRALVDEGCRKIDRWTGRHGIAHAAWPTDPIDPFFNTNTPEDLAAAETAIRRHGEP